MEAAAIETPFYTATVTPPSLALHTAFDPEERLRLLAITGDRQGDTPAPFATFIRDPIPRRDPLTPRDMALNIGAALGLPEGSATFDPASVKQAQHQGGPSFPQ
jgi:hypothetical protein